MAAIFIIPHSIDLIKTIDVFDDIEISKETISWQNIEGFNITRLRRLPWQGQANLPFKDEIDFT